MHVVLTTKLSYEECRQRLASAIDQDTLWSIGRHNRPVYGTLTDSGFRLYKRTFSTFAGKAIPATGDPYRPFLEGRFIKHASRTEIGCTTRTPIAIRLLTLIWFIGLVAIGGPLMILCLWSISSGDTSSSQGNLWFGVFLPPLMGILAWLRIAHAQSKGQRDTAYLIDFLHQVVEAKEVERHP